MGCGCGKKRMTQYSSRQLQQQANGQVVDGALVASSTGESTVTGQGEQSTVDTGAARGAARKV